MILITAFDLLVAQIEKTIQINARLKAKARDERDRDKFDHFSRRLNSLYNKSIVARAEVTNLTILGCAAVASRGDN